MTHSVDLRTFNCGRKFVGGARDHGVVICTDELQNFFDVPNNTREIEITVSLGKSKEAYEYKLWPREMGTRTIYLYGKENYAYKVEVYGSFYRWLENCSCKYISVEIYEDE